MDERRRRETICSIAQQALVCVRVCVCVGGGVVGGGTNRMKYLAGGSQEQPRGRPSRWELFLSRAA